MLDESADVNNPEEKCFDRRGTGRRPEIEPAAFRIELSPGEADGR